MSTKGEKKESLA
jgi:hypothetical protein